MKITQIQQAKKNSDRVNLFLDEEYWTSLTKDQLLEYQLSKGQEITLQEKEKIENAHSDGKLLEKVYKFISIRPRSEKEVFEYLTFRRGLEKPGASKVIDKLKAQKYINDNEFAMWFINQRSEYGLHGPLKIKAELIKKGVSSEIINEVMKDFKNTDISIKIRQYIEKETRRIKAKNDFELRQKLGQKLLAKGFSYDDIENALSHKL